MSDMQRIAGTVGAAIDIYEALAEFFNDNKGTLGGDGRSQAEVIARVIFVGVQAFQAQRAAFPEEVGADLDDDLAAIGKLPVEQRMIATLQFLYRIRDEAEELCEQ